MTTSGTLSIVVSCGCIYMGVLGEVFCYKEKWNRGVLWYGKFRIILSKNKSNRVLT